MRQFGRPPNKNGFGSHGERFLRAVGFSPDIQKPTLSANNAVSVVATKTPFSSKCPMTSLSFRWVCAIPCSSAPNFRHARRRRSSETITSK